MGLAARCGLCGAVLNGDGTCPNAEKKRRGHGEPVMPLMQRGGEPHRWHPLCVEAGCQYVEED